MAYVSSDIMIDINCDHKLMIDKSGVMMGHKYRVHYKRKKNKTTNNLPPYSTFIPLNFYTEVNRRGLFCCVVSVLSAVIMQTATNKPQLCTHDMNCTPLNNILHIFIIFCQFSVDVF